MIIQRQQYKLFMVRHELLFDRMQLLLSNKLRHSFDTAMPFAVGSSISNVAENFFTVVRAVYTDYRELISPVNQEVQSFLRFTKKY